MESTRYSRAYMQGYNDAYDGDIVRDGINALSKAVPIPNFTEESQKEEDSYRAGYTAGMDDRMSGRPHAHRPDPEPEPAHSEMKYRSTSVVSGSSSDSDRDTSEGNPVVAVAILCLIVGVVYAIYWLSVNLVLPILLLNSALWFTIYGLITKRRKQLFFALSFGGGAYLLYDMRKGWLSQNFVRNVTHDPVWLDGFVVVNAIALGLAAWFLTKGLREAAYEVGPSDTANYKLKMGAAVTAIVVAAVTLPAVHFISKPDPQGDGQLIAADQCKCVEQYNQQLAEAGQQFLDRFSSHGFKTRTEARTAYAPVYNSANEALGQCANAVQAKLNAKQAEHQTDFYYGQALMGAFHVRTATCMLNQTARTGYDQKVQTLVETITEPRPDLERMKADLVGRTIPNWTFKSTNDFTNVVNTGIYGTDTRLESHLDMDLNDPEGRSPTARLVLVYNLRDGQWWLDQVNHKEVVYHLTVTNDSWYQWPIPKGANYTFNSGKIWVVSDRGYRRIKCGPDVGGQTIPHSSKLQFASREKNAAASIRFTFKPKEN